MTWLSLALALVVLSGCRRDPDSEPGAPPPPAVSAQPAACHSGGGMVADAASAAYFPRRAGHMCIDPNGETRVYGAGTSESIDKVCLEQFNGECEVYKGYGLERLVTLRYVDADGSPGAVAVNLSRFTTPEGAYGFFTRRIIGGADPAERAPEVLAAGAAAAIGAGPAAVVRGNHVVELTYTNEREPTDRVGELARRALPPIAVEMGRRLPGDLALPAAARALPEAGRLRLGIAYEIRDLLGVPGAGGGAVGYYRDGDKRWRVACAVRPDEAGAADVIGTLAKALGAKAEKGTVFRALRFTLAIEGAGGKLEWVMARAGARVYAVGDEEYVAGGDRPAEEVAKGSLSLAQKLEILGKLVSGEPEIAR